MDSNTGMAIQLLYGSQSHAIDSGRAGDWAASFTDDGVFDSPSYPEPVTGTSALTAFAEQFHESATAAQEKRRHVLTNLAISPVDEHEVTVDCYLQIVATPRGGDTRILRFTAVHDSVVSVHGEWKIRRRTVTRDDS